MTHDHHDVRTELGAYVLGALEPADRHRVERHLEDCPTCREEVGRLAVLPPLLDRLSPQEATADPEQVDSHLDAIRDGATAAERRHLRRQVTTWRLAAAIAAAVACAALVVAWQPWEQPPDRIVVAIVPADRHPVTGTVAAYAWEWGTTVEVRVQELPEAGGYELWAVSLAGERQRAGTWGPTADHGAMVRGASGIQRADLARVEVTDPTGAVLFDADFTDAPT